MKKTNSTFRWLSFSTWFFCSLSWTAETLETKAQNASVFLRYQGIFDGPAPLNPSRHRPDAFGEVSEDDPIQVRNSVALGRFQTDSPELSEISAACTWTLRPLSIQTADLGDPYARYSQTRAFSLEQGFIGFDLRGVFPLSQESRNSGLRVGFETHPTLYYAIAHSRWALESNSGLRVNFATQEAERAQRPLPFWALRFSPGAAYQLTHRWEFTPLFHFGLTQQRGAPLTNSGTVFEPGLRWSSIQGNSIQGRKSHGLESRLAWRVHPYLKIPLLPSISPRLWTFGAEVSAVLF